ncbi:PAS domain S-box protein [Caulobacter sp. DWP3-1-3b2]|uniref:PAS domain-containing protein n=1 Tax=unclassified Caulobacter TaxID=2648921 RepID=UPI003CFB92A4
MAIEPNRATLGSTDEFAAALEDFFDNGSIGLHLVGSDGLVLRANQAELDLLGYTADEYIGRPIAALRADAESNALNSYHGASTGKPAEVSGELFFRLDGSSFPVAGVELIGKPFTFEQMAARVRDVLDTRAKP